MGPNANASDQAKARLAALEADPKHSSDPDLAAVEETREHSLDDPGHQNPHAVLDPKWHKDAAGNWTHPDFEGND